MKSKIIHQLSLWECPKYLWLCLFSLCVCFSNVTAQRSVFYGTIVDSEGSELQGATIEDQTSGFATISNRRGEFSLTIDSLSILEIRYVGFKSVIIDQISFVDTVRQFIQMEREIENFQEFVVRSRRFKPIAKDDAVNVLDFRPYPEFVLALETIGRKRYLSFYQEFDSVERFSTKRIKGKSLFEDCFGNIHILNDDSAYQVFVNEELHIISAISIEQFDESIRSCVAKFEENTFFEGYSRSNKMYSLLGYEPNSKEPKCHFSVWDEIGEEMAHIQYDTILALYFASTPLNQNLITNKSWSGDMIALANTPDLLSRISWYTKVLLRNVEVKTFSMNGQLVAFDCLNDSIVIMDQGGTTIGQIPFGDGTEKVKEIIFDSSTQQFYTFNLDGAYSGIYSIDIATGKKQFVGSTRGLGRSENVKIFGGDFYFILNEDGYGNLYRASLDDLNH
jgi:hypothetical protein